MAIFEGRKGTRGVPALSDLVGQVEALRERQSHRLPGPGPHRAFKMTISTLNCIQKETGRQCYTSKSRAAITYALHNSESVMASGSFQGQPCVECIAIIQTGK